jgi:hypothetical protein
VTLSGISITAAISGAPPLPLPATGSTRPHCTIVRCAQAPLMPEGRAERAVETGRKSIDGAEHSGMLGVGFLAGLGLTLQFFVSYSNRWRRD